MALLPLIGAGLAIARGAKSLFGRKKPNRDQQMMDKYDQEFDEAIPAERQFRDRRESDYDRWMTGTEGAIDRFEGRGSSLDDLGPENFNPDDLERFDSGDVSGYRPGRLQRFDPSRVSGFDPEELRGYSSGLDDYDEGPGGVASDISRLRSFRSAATGFNPEQFDAEGAVRKYATGAWSDTERNLKRGLSDLEAGQAGGGRLRSGFFDEDRGDVITEATRGFTADLARQSVAAADITQRAVQARDAARLEAAGLTDRGTLTALQSAASAGNEAAARKLDALKAAAELRFKRAGAIDESRQRAGETGAELELRAGTAEGEIGQNAVAEGARLRLEQAKGLTGSRQQAQEFRDRYKLDVGRGRDEYALGRGQISLGARQRAAELAGGRAEAGRDRYLDTLTGGINRRQQRLNAEAQRRESRTAGILGLAGKGIEAFGPAIAKKYFPVSKAG